MTFSVRVSLFAFLSLLAPAADTLAQAPADSPPVVETPALEASGVDLLLAVGAPGEPAFDEAFRAWAARFQTAASLGGASCTTIGLDPAPADATPTDRDRLLQALATLPADGPGALWIVLLGHGTYDRRTAKFNLRGPDLATEDLVAALARFRRPLVILNCTSASGPWLPALKGPDRYVVTATRSGDESNFARFGDHLSQAVLGGEADLDKDGQVSLLEAYLTAARRTAAFYEQEGRLATEHSLLDDNADGRGTPADWYSGLRPVRKPADGLLDGPAAARLHLVPSAAERALPAHLRARRDLLEQLIARLRTEKNRLDPDLYYVQLELLALALARLPHSASSPSAGERGASAP